MTGGYDPDRYAAAALIERVAIGDEDGHRERNRRLILAGGEVAEQAAREARRAAVSRLVDVERAIETLGIDA